MNLKDWIDSSALNAANAAFLEEHPYLVPDDWLGRALDRQAGVECLLPEKLFESKQVGALRIINAYRFLGARHADLDPLARFEREVPPELTPEYYGIGPADLEQEYDTGTLIGPSRARLGDTIARLRRIYCSSVVVEYMHLSDVPRKRWIQERM